MANAEIQIEMVVMSRLDLERLIDYKFEQLRTAEHKAMADSINGAVREMRRTIQESSVQLTEHLAAQSADAKALLAAKVKAV